MKALILAAGLGTRLAPLTKDRPKSMVAVNGIPIIHKQIENLLKNNITDIYVVTGYFSNILASSISSQYPSVKFIHSKEYETTNNMYSAYLSRDIIGNSAFIMMNADVFFDSSIITSLLSDTSESCIVTDIGTFNEESMKVIVTNNRVIKISKNITRAEAYGSSIDVYKFSSHSAKVFFSKCSQYIERDAQRKLWSEVALNDILPDVHFTPTPVNGRWYEIDNHEDLAAAEQLFMNEK